MTTRSPVQVHGGSFFAARKRRNMASSTNVFQTDSRYLIIYCDPPWRYRQKTARGAAERHYPTMSFQELCALPVANIAAKDCALFLWTTFPQLPEALRLIRAWGFIYKTAAFVWLKKNKVADSWFFGLGSYTRSNAEVCLLAVKGKPKRLSAGVSQVIVHPVMEHSRKPDEVRDRIVELFGNVPRIELFARQIVPGWDCWGNEIPDFFQAGCDTIYPVETAIKKVNNGTGSAALGVLGHA